MESIQFVLNKGMGRPHLTSVEGQQHTASHRSLLWYVWWDTCCSKPISAAFGIYWLFSNMSSYFNDEIGRFVLQSLGSRICQLLWESHHWFWCREIEHLFQMQLSSAHWSADQTGCKKHWMYHISWSLDSVSTLNTASSANISSLIKTVLVLAFRWVKLKSFSSLHVHKAILFGGGKEWWIKTEIYNPKSIRAMTYPCLTLHFRLNAWGGHCQNWL